MTADRVSEEEVERAIVGRPGRLDQFVPSIAVHLLRRLLAERARREP